MFKTKIHADQSSMAIPSTLRLVRPVESLWANGKLTTGAADKCSKQNTAVFHGRDARATGTEKQRPYKGAYLRVWYKNSVQRAADSVQ